MAFLENFRKEYPIDIMRLEIFLSRSTPPESTSVEYQASYHLVIKYNDEKNRVETGDLIPHLTTGQISALRNLLDNLTDEAQRKIDAINVT